MKRKVIAVAAAFLLIVLILLYMTYQKNKPITLTFGMFAGSNWDVPNGESYKIIDEVVERFERKHPNVKVEYVSGLQKSDYSEWLSQQALKGNLPDVFMIRSNDLSTFSDIGIMQNLNSYIHKDDAFDKAAYFTPSYQSGTYQKKQYALPYESVPTLMYVNRTLLEKEGISLPSDDWTWADFYDICRRVTKDTNEDGALDQFGVYGYGWQNAVASNGATVFYAEGTKATLSDERVYEAIEFTRRLEELNQGMTPTSEMFDKGQVVFCPMRFSEYRTYKPYPWRVKKYSSFEWECIPMPAGPQGDNVSELDTLLMGMAKTSQHKDLAWEFLKMLSYDETTQEDIFAYSQGVSVLKDITNSKTVSRYLQEDTPGESAFKLDFFNKTMEHAIPVNKFSDYDQAMSVADSEIRRLLSTDEDIKTMVNTLQSKLDILLQN